MPDKKELSAIDIIYDQINNVLGGTNGDQMLCLTIPGTVLDKKTFEYDTRFEKPFKVAANESRLANKLFDVTKVTGSDNGRQLSRQFLSALDMLSPKINSQLMDTKDDLRGMLKLPATYKVDQSNTVESTLQEAFYYMYGEYVKEKQLWAEKQNEKRKELEEQYPGTSDETQMQRQEAFLNWYQTVAETYIAKIDVKRGQILSFFSPNDMNVIEDILSSGNGTELEEARKSVENAKRFDPNGDYISPVTIQPNDWFECLDSNMGFIDMLQTSDVYSMEYSSLQSKRRALLHKISLFEKNNKGGDLEKLITELNGLENDMVTAENSLNACFAENTSIVLNGVIDLIGDETSDLLSLETLFNQLNVKKLVNPVMLKSFEDAYVNTAKITSSYVDLSTKIAEKSRELIASKSSNFTHELKESYQQLDAINEEIENVKDKLRMALAKESNPNNKVDLFPDAYKKRFMEVLIKTNMSQVNAFSNNAHSACDSSYGTNFLFGSVKTDNSSSSSISQLDTSSSNMDIEISFLATKISIVRNWFNPDVFLLSRDIYRSSNAVISTKTIDTESQANSLFPCYPTSFVIAKDVTIRFSSAEESDSTIHATITEHASKGGGFLCFSGRSSSSSSSQSDSSVATRDSNGVTIKLPGPQIIGYYLQIVPED